jgi:hypothetical protein
LTENSALNALALRLNEIITANGNHDAVARAVTKINMLTLFLVLAVGYITLVSFGGITHNPIRAKRGRRRWARMLLKYELLGFAVLYLAWTIYKAVMNWTDRRTDRRMKRKRWALTTFSMEQLLGTATSGLGDKGTSRFPAVSLCGFRWHP